MKWQGRRQSRNIDDRRGRRPMGSPGGMNPLMLMSLFKFLFSKTGLILVGAVVAFSWFTGVNPLSFLGTMLGGGHSLSTSSSTYEPSAKEELLAEFCATILADTEDVWNDLIENYREPTLVLFTNSVSSACGMASSASGPFYCPSDEKLYIDLSFFQEMENKLNAPGDFAQAYVIAHEVGHHVQNILGISGEVQELRGTLSQTEYNEYSVRLELQADFSFWSWAHHSQRTAD